MKTPATRLGLTGIPSAVDMYLIAFPFVAVILDCLTDVAKSSYRSWDFEELPGHPNRLFVSYQQLEAMMNVHADDVPN
jgi:hypothetical protein